MIKERIRISGTYISESLDENRKDNGEAFIKKINVSITNLKKKVRGHYLKKHNYF